MENRTDLRVFADSAEPYQRRSAPGSRIRFVLRTYWWTVLTCFAVVSFLLGWTHGPRGISVDGFYESVQLFVFNGRQDSDGARIGYHIARFLSPVVLGIGALLVLLEFWREFRFWLARLEDHTVVIGIDRKGRQLVEDFTRKDGRTGAAPRVIAVDRTDSDQLRACRARGALTVLGDLLDPLVLDRAKVHRARHVFCVTPDDAANAEIAVRLATHSGKSTCFAHVADLELLSELRRMPPFDRPHDHREFRLFSGFTNSARLLFWDDPPDLHVPGLRTRERAPHFVVVGIGGMGESVVLQAIRVCHYRSEQPLRITLVDRRAEERKDRLLRRYPGLADPDTVRVCEIAHRRREIEDGEGLLEELRELDDFDCVYVCIENDALSFAAGVAVKKAYPTKGVFVRLAERGGLSTLLSGDSAPTPFGFVDESCMRAIVANENLDRVAKEFHEAYLRRRHGTGHGSGNPWERLGTAYRDANRHAVDHIPFKLRVVGYAWERSDEPGEDLTEEQVEQLAPLEHRRWCAERILEGWVYGPTKQEEPRESPHLVAWDRFDAGAKDLDRAQVRQIPVVLRELGIRIVA